MARSTGNIGWVQTKDGQIDQRYTMPQVRNNDGSRDRRCNLFSQPQFGESEPLTNGYSKYYQPTNTSHVPGVYQILTTTGTGRPTARYAGMTNDIYRRVDEHGRGGPDNISPFMYQAQTRGIDTRVCYAQADSTMEARAQELFLLDRRNYDWNSQNNGNTNRYWYR